MRNVNCKNYINNEKHILAFDIGGTFIKYGIFDMDGIECFAKKVPTNTDTKGFFEQISQIINDRKESYGALDGIAISIPGFINSETGENADFTVPKCFTAYNLKNELQKRYEIPVTIENDSNCAAIAELTFGAGKGVADFVMVTVGTGLGSAIIIDHKLYRGHHFKAGELGFSILNGSPCRCATSDLVERAGVVCGRKVSGEYVFQNLSNSAIRRVYEEWITELATVIGNFISVLDVQKVLIGGGISAEPVFIRDIREKVHSMFLLKEYTEVIPCAMGNNAGKMGAVILWMQKYGKEA